MGSRAPRSGAEQIVALLDAAQDLDSKPLAKTSGRRSFIATLVFAGLRVSEVCQLRWRDVDLAKGRLYVADPRTDAGVREVDLLPVLRDEPAAHKGSARIAGPDTIVFPTATGSARDKDNARERVIRPVVKRADELLSDRGHAPLPVGVTAHKLRHTFASILVALGGDPTYVMGQLGHTDPESRCVSTPTRCGETTATATSLCGSSVRLLGQKRAEVPPTPGSRAPGWHDGRVRKGRAGRTFV